METRLSFISTIKTETTSDRSSLQMIHFQNSIPMLITATFVLQAL